MNDKALAALGEVFKSELNVSENWELYAENLFPDNEHKVITVLFTADGEKGKISVNYKGTDISPYDNSSYRKYLYRRGSPNGGDITPTTKFSGIDSAETLKSKKVDTILNNVLRRIVDLADNNSEDETAEREIFIRITDLWRNNYEKINTDIHNIYSSLSKDEKFKCGITIGLVRNGELLRNDKLNLLKKALILDGTEGMSVFTGVRSEGENRQCSVCNEIKPRLHGFAAPFKYFTVDKKGYISNYFNLKLAWKNYPVCEDCAQNLYLGSRMLKENLFFRFYRRNYMAVPRLLTGNEAMLGSLVNFLKELKSNLKEAVSEEDIVMEYIASSENYFFLDLVFIDYDAKSQTMKIKSHVEEVLPSRFRTLFKEAREAVNDHITFTNFLAFEEFLQGSKKQAEIYKFRFRFGYLLQFFDDEDYSPIQNAFYGNKFREKNLFERFMNFYRDNYSLKLQGKPYHSLRKTVIEAIGVILYLSELGLLEFNKINYEVKMENKTENLKKESSFDLERLKEFIEANPQFFDRKYKIGLFTLGILIKLVMNIQNANLGSTPFER
ncbi:MAG: hypothetical protein HUU43_14850, partial [Ignavibacteriaceae bacterium]|nr:hypothetical protein [Ignavibacteriaceae bacterium]